MTDSGSARRSLAQAPVAGCHMPCLLVFVPRKLTYQRITHHGYRHRIILSYLGGFKGLGLPFGLGPPFARVFSRTSLSLLPRSLLLVDNRGLQYRSYTLGFCIDYSAAA